MRGFSVGNGLRKRIGMMVLIFMMVFLLSACGSGQNGVIQEGVKGMKDVIGELTKALDAQDAAKVKEVSEELEEKWEGFEESVKEKSKDLYEKAETPLKAIEAGAKISPLDVAALKKAVQELTQALDEVKNL